MRGSAVYDSFLFKVWLIFFRGKKQNVFSKPLYLPKRQMRLTDESSFEISLFVYPPLYLELIWIVTNVYETLKCSPWSVVSLALLEVYEPLIDLESGTIPCVKIIN